MKKIVAILIMLTLLCACGAGEALPVGEPPVEVAAPIEAEAQTEDIMEEEPPPAPPRVVSSERHRSVEELERVTIQRALYEGGEELIFHFDETVSIMRVRELLDDGSERWDRQEHWGETIVTIENSNGEFIQQLEPALSSFRSGLHTEYITPAVPPTFFDSIDQNVDINFDGYPDLVWFSGLLTRALFRYGWVWNPQLGRFDETNLLEIPNMHIDEERQRIRGGSSSGGHRQEMIYRFIDGSFVVTNRLEFIPRTPYFVGDDYERWSELEFNYVVGIDGRTITLREQHLENGEMVDTWPIITDTEEGLAIMYEHLFGEDSIWFPGWEW